MSYTIQKYGERVETKEPVPDTEFDPSEHKVTEVNAYMTGASEDEQARVLEDEQAGKDRSTIADIAFNPSDHTVVEVNEYLATAHQNEQTRVLEDEKAGKNRSTVGL
jgi:hypothetical protein